MIKSQKVSINLEEIEKIFEPLIRRIIREELVRVINREPDIFYLEPNMPIYNDMEEIKQRKEMNEIKLHSHEEVWSE